MKRQAAARNLAGKTALVTDATSELGYQVAFALAEAGAVTHVVVRDHAQCRGRVESLRSTGRTVVHVVDLRDGASLACFTEMLTEHLSALHIVISNAGIAAMGSGCATQEGSNDADGHAISGALHWAEALLPPLRDAARQGSPARVISVGGNVANVQYAINRLEGEGIRLSCFHSDDQSAGPAGRIVEDLLSHENGWRDTD